MELCLQYITRPDSGHSIYVTIKIPCTVFKELSSPQKSGSDLRLGAIHLWRPHRGVQAQVDGGGVKPHVDIHTEN